MKRFLLISIVALIGATYASAQNCTPDMNITKPGVYPEQPDTAYVGVAYDFVFQVLAIKDTSTTFGGQPVTAEIDSVKVNNVLGLPAGFSYLCEPASCTFSYKSVGCVKLSGNPSNAIAGVYDISIATTAYARIGTFKIPQPDTADGYKLVIIGGAAVITPVSEQIAVYPNPAVDGKFIVGTKLRASSLFVTNLQGKLVEYDTEEVQNGYSVDISMLPKGVYFIQMTLNGTTLTKKIIH
jgi:hypothetical protein